MAKLANLITMVELLQNGRKYSIKELAENLEVSPRVIREYKLFLEEAGIYLDTIRGPYGGYVLNTSIHLPILYFNEKDVTSLKKATNYISDATLKEEIKNIYNKMMATIQKEEKKTKHLLTDNLEKQIYNQISYALRNEQKLKIKYYNLQHGVSIRTIYPLGLYLFQNEWWISSYWEEKDDLRQFHLKRIQSCEILKEKFNPKEINIKF